MLNWQIDRNCFCKKCLIGILVLKCEDEIFNITQTSLNDNKVVCEKSNCLIHTISVVIICLLLLVIISISCYYCYTRDLMKKTMLIAILI